MVDTHLSRHEQYHFMDITGHRSRLVSKSEIKVENSDEDISEFAESTMNELLGWYGYESRRNEEKNMIPCCSQNGSTSSGPDSPKYSGGCDWCGHVVNETKAISSAGAVFCSELCFSQSRRANFKKNKTCDWCRHVRHTVSHVDFQDGASQLQFCSDKCLNQYKMHIFCRETRAHLEMHPHFPEEGKSGGSLITPDLWFKNCRSTDSTSVSPPPYFISPKEDTETSPLPLITIVHPSKLLDQGKEPADPLKRHKGKLPKKKRKRISLETSCIPGKSSYSEYPQDLRVKPSIDNGPSCEDLRRNMLGFGPPTDYRNQYNNKLPPSLPQAHTRFYSPKMFAHSSLAPPPVTSLPGNSLPPVTILIPFPVMVPLPLPIPIPFDSNLLKSNKAKTSADNDELISNKVKNDPIEKAPNIDNSKLDGDSNGSPILDGKEALMEKCSCDNNLTSKESSEKFTDSRTRQSRKRKRILEMKRRPAHFKTKKVVST